MRCKAVPKLPILAAFNTQVLLLPAVGFVLLLLLLLCRDTIVPLAWRAWRRRGWPAVSQDRRML